MADEKDEVLSSPEVHFEPVIRLPEVETKTFEEDEEELLKLRAKLFRYAATENPPEWKERGTGDVKLLRHVGNGTVRLLMRRDKTLKVCANHYITPWMELKPNCGSDRAWVWSVPADFADEEPKQELLAIRFANAENAKKFKEKFDDCKTMVADMQDQMKQKDDEKKKEEEANDVARKLEELSVKDGSGDKHSLEKKPSEEEKSSSTVGENDSSPTSEDGEKVVAAVAKE